MRTIQEFQFSKMNVLLTDPIKLENLLSLVRTHAGKNVR